MPLVNPAKNLYFNMDIENIEKPSLKKEESKGLLAPRKNSMSQKIDMSNEPVFRVGQHMLLLRKQREMLKND